MCRADQLLPQYLVVYTATHPHWQRVRCVVVPEEFAALNARGQERWTNRPATAPTAEAASARVKAVCGATTEGSIQPAAGRARRAMGMGYALVPNAMRRARSEVETAVGFGLTDQNTATVVPRGFSRCQISSRVGTFAGHQGTFSWPWTRLRSPPSPPTPS